MSSTPGAGGGGGTAGVVAVQTAAAVTPQQLTPQQMMIRIKGLMNNVETLKKRVTYIKEANSVLLEMHHVDEKYNKTERTAMRKKKKSTNKGKSIMYRVSSVLLVVCICC